MGKFEKRKHTKEIIQAWIKKYGNNNKYLLSCCVVNPFIKHEQMNALLSDVLDGKHYSNVNFLPHLKTNSEVNHLLNSGDIDLTGLSGAEGWNLPSFNATALGKWALVYNHSAHTAWATKNNSLLLEPEEKEKAADGLFFAESGDFNIGNICGFNEDKVIAAMEQAESKVGIVNTEGLKLQ
jgi:aryl-alcohol dehydrogenase-like predicted oxidoreductase